MMVYQIEAYRYWESHLGRNDFEFGQFEKNSHSMAFPMTRSVTETGTESAAPCLK